MAPDAQTGNTNASHNYTYSALYTSSSIIMMIVIMIMMMIIIIIATTTIHGHKGLANKLNYFAFWIFENYLHPPALHPWVGLGLTLR